MNSLSNEPGHARWLLAAAFVAGALIVSLAQAGDKQAEPKRLTPDADTPVLATPQLSAPGEDASPEIPPAPGPDSVESSAKTPAPADSSIMEKPAQELPQSTTVPLPDSKSSTRRKPTIEPWPTGARTASAAPTARKVSIERIAPDDIAPQAAQHEPAHEDQPTADTRPARLKISLDLLPTDPGAPPRNLQDLSPTLDLMTPESSSFKGIQPGVSTMTDVRKRWGAGEALPHDGDDESRYLYSVDPYKHIEVTFDKRFVSSVAVKLDKPADNESLATQLHLDSIVAVRVSDERGEELGQSFPERGIMFSFAPKTHSVTQILIEPLDAEPFVVRASINSEQQIRRSLVDLEHAIQLDDEYALAHLTRAQIMCDIGRYDEALASADRALKLDGANPSCRLAKAEILAHLARSADAQQIAQALVDDKKSSRLIKARSTCLLGDVMAMGPDHDYPKAVELHQSAIELASPLADDADGAVRRQAKRVMLDAHLGAAGDIAAGTYRSKTQVASRWIERADELVKDLIRNEHVDRQVGLYAARRTLEAGAAANARLDKDDWATRVIDQSQRLVDATDDPLRRQKMQWEAGLGLFAAVQIDERQVAKNYSLAESLRALDDLAQGGMFRQHTPDDDYMFGRLYAHIGAAYAVNNADHTMAVTWFDRALPLLDRPLPPSAAQNIGRHGEALVSMGISYWAVGRKEDAVKVTEQGAELMARAVKNQLLDERALSIPYSNLASMHRALGHDPQATSFADLAERYEATKRK